tara:strand:+ start:418 stop:594 length:177 start_codon:yes stop_codon:yes gene_type:complete
VKGCFDIFFIGLGIGINTFSCRSLKSFKNFIISLFKDALTIYIVKTALTFKTLGNFSE